MNGRGFTHAHTVSWKWIATLPSPELHGYWFNAP